MVIDAVPDMNVVHLMNELLIYFPLYEWTPHQFFRCLRCWTNFFSANHSSEFIWQYFITTVHPYLFITSSAWQLNTSRCSISIATSARFTPMSLILSAPSNALSHAEWFLRPPQWLWTVADNEFIILLITESKTIHMRSSYDTHVWAFAVI